MQPDSSKIEVTVRANSGENKTIPASDVENAMSIVKENRTTDNHMVCILQNGVRTQRWDRATFVGENDWHREDPDAFETLGQIRSVRVIRQSTNKDLLGDQIHPAGLDCYQVGESDWFAATSPEQALELMHELVGDDEPYDVTLTGETLLDERWGSEDEPGKDAGSLREWLAAATEPGWLSGTEG
jgi:hypothetical protein